MGRFRDLPPAKSSRRHQRPEPALTTVSTGVAVRDAIDRHARHAVALNVRRWLHIFVLLNAIVMSISCAANDAANASRQSAIVALAVSLDDDGSTLGVPVGGLIQLTLPPGSDWRLEAGGFDVVDHTDLGPEHAARWLLRMSRAGEVPLAAVGFPPCPSASS